MLNRFNIFLILSLLGVMFSQVLMAQDFESAIKKMREAYDESTKLHAIMEITVYESEEDKSPYYFQKAEIFRDQEVYFYKLDDQEILLGKNYFVMVNNKTNEISLSPRDGKNESAIKQQMSFDLDSILSLYKSPEYMGSKNNLDHYRLYQDSTAIQQIDLFLTKPESLLRKMHYYYENGQFVTIEFTLLNLRPELQKAIFEEQKYVVKSEGKFKGAGKYSNYHVYVQ